MTRPARSVLLLLLAVLLLLAAGFIVSRHFFRVRTAAEVAKPSGAVPVAATRARSGEVGETLLLSATLLPAAEVIVVARSAGEVVAKHVAVGQNVSEGLLLYQVDTRTYAANVRQAEAAVKQSKAATAGAHVRCEQAQAEYERAKRLYQAGSATPQALEAAAAGYQQASAAVEQAEAAGNQALAALDLARLALEYCDVKSPIAGFVTDDFNIDKGDSVVVGMPVARVVDKQTLKALAALPGKYLARVRAGQTRVYVEVDGHPGRIAALVSSVNPAVDPARRAANIEAVFVNPQDAAGRLLLSPGRFARLHLVLSSERGVVVPASAVVRRDNLDFVVVLEERQRMHLKHVVVGMKTSTEAVIRDGLEAGELVMREGVLFAYEGAAVSIVEEAEAASR